MSSSPHAATSIPPLRIALLCTPARVGGLERVVQALARGLAGQGHAVTLLAVVGAAPDADPLFAPLRGLGVTLRPLVFGSRAYAAERREVRALLRDLAPDVVHTHGYRCDLLHGGPTRRAGIATVSTVHGSSRMGGLSHLFEWMQLRALRGFDAVIPVSAPLETTLRRVGVAPGRLHLLPNAVSPRPERTSPAAARAALGIADDAGPVLGWVGRLVPVKGADILLHALARLPGGAWRVSIIGDGPDRPALEALAAQLGIAGRVRFHGEVDDAARYLPAFDALVLSSRSEGTPIVVLEAMQAAVPVVAARVGGVPDLLGDGVAGWLVATEDPDALAEGLRVLLEHPAEGARRGAAGRVRIAEAYDPARWIAEHERIYRAAIARRRVGR